MQDNDKVTLTFGQLKKLLKESNVPDMPSPRKFTTNIKEYFKKRFGMKLETLKDYPSYLFKKIIDRRFNGDANALLKFFKKISILNLY